MGRFDGKVVLLTGSGGGQGRVAAMRFAREGATVVGCDVNAAGHAETQSLLAAEGLTLHGSAPVDLGDPEQARQWVDGAAEQHGRIDVLYNNASAARFGPVGEFSVEDWRYTMRNELDLIFFTTKFAWRHLAVRGGVVLNISSVAAWAGSKVAGISAHARSRASWPSKAASSASVPSASARVSSPRRAPSRSCRTRCRAPPYSTVC
jgi:meso-butanediol dehydrogenase / (S,S)-butanediol dehydrogenase / diacetyl reductase